MNSYIGLLNFFYLFMSGLYYSASKMDKDGYNKPVMLLFSRIYLVLILVINIYLYIYPITL